MAPKGIIITIMLAMIIFTVPAWPYAKPWGFYPSGWISVALVIFLGLVLTGVI